MTSPSLAHVDRLPVEVRPLVKEDAPVVEANDQVVPPSKRSLLSPCSASASETSDVRDLQMTSFLADCVWQILVQDLLSTALFDHYGAEVRWHLPRPPRARTKLLSLSPWTARNFASEAVGTSEACW